MVKIIAADQKEVVKAVAEMASWGIRAAGVENEPMKYEEENHDT